MNKKRRKNLIVVGLFILIPLLIVVYIRVEAEGGFRNLFGINRHHYKVVKHVSKESKADQILKKADRALKEADQSIEEYKEWEKEFKKKYPFKYPKHESQADYTSAQRGSLTDRVRADISSTYAGVGGDNLLVEIYSRQCAINIIMSCSPEDARSYVAGAIWLARDVVGEDYTVMCVVKNQFGHLAGAQMFANSNILHWE